MNDTARAIVIAAFLVGGAVVMRGMFGTDRFELSPSAGGTVYRLDRLTGGVSFCTPAACRALPNVVPAITTIPRGQAAPGPATRTNPAPPKSQT